MPVLPEDRAPANNGDDPAHACARRIAHLAACLFLVLGVAAAAARGQEAPTTSQKTHGELATSPATASLPASEPANQERPVDFATEIQPILSSRCWKCHGTERSSGGLRLDGKKHALGGGDSGKTVLGRTLGNSELYARVSSSDRSYRMPKNSPPLPAGEIDLLRRWLEQGSPWPEPMPLHSSQSKFDQWATYAAEIVDRYEAEYRYVQPFTIGFLVLMILLLVVVRCKTAYRAGRAWTLGRLAGFCRFCDRVRTREVLLVMFVSLALLSLAWLRGRLLNVEQQLVRVQTKAAKTHSLWASTVYGYPPKPVRPDHPKQVAGTYYRGNCERNRELFNGGNYLTTTFRVNLCDEQHRRLEVGQPLPKGGVFVRLEIERAPGTTDQLFSKELMASVMLTRNFYESPNAMLREEPSRLQIIEPGKRWEAFVPIGMPNEQHRIEGTIYLYTGQVKNNELGGSLHNGIGYALVFTDGKLAAESDLWMDSFGNGMFEPPRLPGKLPYREWFDYRPMPVITGENSKDPKLLGVDEYIEKGLIKPEGSPAKEPPRPAQPESPPHGE